MPVSTTASTLTRAAAALGVGCPMIVLSTASTIEVERDSEGRTWVYADGVCLLRVLYCDEFKLVEDGVVQ